MIECTFEDGNKNNLRHVVVDCLVLKEDKILLSKRSEKLLFEGGKWCLPGGFIEMDETIKDGARREVFEETGYEIKELKLLRIIDAYDRPNEDRQNVAFVYYGSAGERKGESDWETAEQKWFKFSDLPPKEKIAFDHYDSIQYYIKYKKEKFSLPYIK